jgi:hypothetical protein
LAPPGVDRSKVAECDPDFEMHRAEAAQEDLEGVFKQSQCFVVTMHRDEDAGECGTVGSGCRVIRPDHLSPDTEGFSGGGFTVSRSSGGMSQPPEVVQNRRDLGMLAPESCGEDRKGGLVQIASLVEAAGVLEQNGKVVTNLRC